VVEHPVFCSVGRQLELVVVRKGRGRQDSSARLVDPSIHPISRAGGTWAPPTGAVTATNASTHQQERSMHVSIM
jgi:hypothetical protein